MYDYISKLQVQKNIAKDNFLPGQAASPLRKTPGITMDHEKKLQIDRILKAVHSIHDLDKRTIDELTGTLAGRFMIEKFKVKPSKWRAWKKGKGEMQGVEYDAKKQHLIIKAEPSELYETINAAMTGWSHMVARKLRKATKTRFRYSENLGHELSGRHQGTFLQPDQCIHRRSQKFPLAILDIAVSEPTPQVFKDAEKFLEGSNGQTKLAIVIDINEHRTKRQKKPTRCDLSDDGILKFSIRDIVEHILHWHDKEGIPLLGDFNACVYLRFQSQDWRAIWEHKFSLDGPVEKPLVHDNSYISTKDLLPELEKSVDLPLPLDALAGEMEDCLDKHQMQRAKVQADMWQKRLRKARPVKRGYVP